MKIKFSHKRHDSNEPPDPPVDQLLILCSENRDILGFTLQSNLNSSNTDGSFTMANSNSFLSPYEILPLAQENKYLGKFSYFIMKFFVCCVYSLESPHRGDSNEYTQHTTIVKEIKKSLNYRYLLPDLVP